MKRIILYGSQYGSARRYAQRLSEQTGIPAVGYQDAPSLSDTELIVYLGGLYAGGVLGMKKALRDLSLQAGQKLVIVTVGIANPELPENRQNIRRSLQKQLPDDLYGKAKIFHLRGAIDYQKLSLSHRTMMVLLHCALENKPAAKWSEEDWAFMDTYGKQVDFMDFDTLQPIIDEIEGEGNERKH